MASYRIPLAGGAFFKPEMTAKPKATELEVLRQKRNALLTEAEAITRRIQDLCPHQWLHHPEADEGWWCSKCGAHWEEDDIL